MSLLSLLQSPWAISAEMLLEIQGIYSTHFRGEKIDIPALEARLGKPLNNSQQTYQVMPGGVAVLGIDGVLAPKMNLFMQISGGQSTAMMARQIESAAVDPKVTSLILAIDSPGGSVHGTPELAATLRAVAAEKPVVTLSSTQLASAGYWVASAANAMFITGPTVALGSIGIVQNHTYTPDPKGRQTTEITAGSYKRIASTVQPLSAEGKAYMQAQVDHVYSIFVDTVAANRGVSAEQVLEHMADGRVFIGQQGIDAGLVDGVSSLDALVEALATDPSKYAQRRKSVFAVPAGSPSSKGAGAASKDKPPTREKGIQMSDAITRASLETDHAPLFALLRTEFMAAGVQAETARIAAVRAQTLPGHEKLIDALAADGKTTGPEAAMAVMDAERRVRAAAADAHTKDAPEPVKGSQAAADKGAPETKAEQVAKARAYAKENKIDFIAAMKELGFAA